MAPARAEPDELVESPYHDPFDDHPLSYPLVGPTCGGSSFRSTLSPRSSYPPSSSLQHSSQSSNTSLEASWLEDATDSEYCSDCKTPDLRSPHDSVLASEPDSCTFDRNDWFAQFDGDIDVSDDPPNRKILDEVGEIPIYDAAGNPRAFKTVYSKGEVVGDRQLVIFIRHFYCGACKAYIDALISHMSVHNMLSPTSIVIIGCGKPELIRHYKASTQCPFPIFADPTRQVFKLLGMGISFNLLGPKRPEYMKDVSVPGWAAGQMREVSKVKGKKRFMGGNLFQIGGEFLFENGDVVWCHRMRNYRGHAEMDVIRRILNITR